MTIVSIIKFVERYDDGTGDFSRRRKESFYWYKKVIETNGEDLSYVSTEA